MADITAFPDASEVINAMLSDFLVSGRISIDEAESVIVFMASVEEAVGE